MDNLDSPFRRFEANHVNYVENAVVDVCRQEGATGGFS